MKSPQEKSRRRYKQLSKEKKLEIARWIVENPDVPVKQVAWNFLVSHMVIYRIIHEYLDIRKQYAFKRVLEPAEGHYDDPLP